jgi:hypothetical protein
MSYGYDPSSDSSFLEGSGIAPTTTSGEPPSLASQGESNTGISSTTSVSIDTTANGRFSFIPSPVVVSIGKDEVVHLYLELMGTLIKGESGISHLEKLPPSVEDPAPSFRLNWETTCAESRQSWNDESRSADGGAHGPYETDRFVLSDH